MIAKLEKKLQFDISIIPLIQYIVFAIPI